MTDRIAELEAALVVIGRPAGIDAQLGYAGHRFQSTDRHDRALMQLINSAPDLIAVVKAALHCQRCDIVYPFGYSPEAKAALERALAKLSGEVK
jgi:hypothetical protein